MNKSLQIEEFRVRADPLEREDSDLLILGKPGGDLVFFLIFFSFNTWAIVLNMTILVGLDEYFLL